MRWEILSKKDASRITTYWQNLSVKDFDELVDNWSVSIPDELNDDYRKVREDIMRAFNDINQKVSKSLQGGYSFDLKFAICLYRILDKYGFGVRIASNEQVWIFFSVKVFPDIIQWRYADGWENLKSENINEKRFWKEKRRIYLRCLWWYIHLSLQKNELGDIDFCKTFKILEKNSTDEMVQIVDRSGSAGYRVDVYREIMRFYAENRYNYTSKSYRELFRRVMVLNTARTEVVEPALMKGGVKTYVKNLFESLKTEIE